ncbi:MAG: sulfite exporter TauE/SafE family protein [Leptolyngbyaceae cyanobacterium SM1_1_3]|nr:sulfite exporter TauE/SafE family protein [Leptolyngbyaceae cyanobacterium SM1_1_3]
MGDGLILGLGGLVSGILAGFLGIGGGTVLVPLMVAVGFTPLQSVATSSLAILITSLTGSWQNWRMGHLSPRRVLMLGFPAVVTAQLGALVANLVAPYILLLAFGLLLLLNVYLVGVRKRVTAEKSLQEAQLKTAADSNSATSAAADGSLPLNPVLARLITGGTAGFLAGLFGIGGGVIMVPLQILLLGETIKTAVRTSLGVIVITAVSACVGHALQGNVLFRLGLVLGLGGLVGVQISTRFLPKLSDKVISWLFRTMLGILSFYIFWQAWQLTLRLENCHEKMF